MPPFDRRSKTPTVARPVSGFDAPANSAKVARMPWEREDDDEFGPPPALDVTPGEAESEAKRMVYEKTHPMNEALLQNAHINHNHAMRRYTALARRAWDPAARDIPVQPAGTVGEDGLAHVPASAQTRPSPLTLSTPRATDPLRASNTLAQHKQLKQSGSPTSPVAAGSQRPLPSEETLARVEAQRQIMRDTMSNARADGPLDPQIAADRDEGEVQARDRGAAARRNDPEAGAPPHAINLDRLADAQAAVAVRNDFSDTTRYILLGLMSYEDIVPDIAGGSFGGIDSNNFEALKEFVSEWRVSEGRSAIAVDSAAELALDELIDFQYAYLISALDPTFEAPAKPDEDAEASVWRTYHESVAENLPLAIAAFTARDRLDNLGPNVIAYQIADSVFNHGSRGRNAILQYAVNMTINAMTPRQRTAGGFKLLQADMNYGSRTAAAVQALANDPVHQQMFLDYFRLGRARWAWDHNQYVGNNRWRIWGITPN